MEALFAETFGNPFSVESFVEGLFGGTLGNPFRVASFVEALFGQILWKPFLEKLLGIHLVWSLLWKRRPHGPQATQNHSRKTRRHIAPTPARTTPWLPARSETLPKATWIIS